MREIHSDQIRASTIQWFNEVVSTRRNSEKSSRVVVMQRGHAKDLSGVLIERGGWEHVNLPMECERKTVIRFPISLREVIREEGSLLWPELFPKSRVDSLKKDLGVYGTAAQFQQTPAPSGGGIVKAEWWKWFTPARTDKWDFVLQSWDTAFKTGEENDYSVCTTWGTRADGYYCLHMYRARVEFPELKLQARMLYDRFRPNQVIVEDKASGQSLIQEFQRDTRLPILPVKVDRDKVTRCHAVSPLIQAGRVFLPQGAEWVQEFVSEFTLFPVGEHDDICDSAGQAIAHLSQALTMPSVSLL